MRKRSILALLFLVVIMGFSQTRAYAFIAFCFVGLLFSLFAFRRNRKRVLLYLGSLFLTLFLLEGFIGIFELTVISRTPRETYSYVPNPNIEHSTLAYWMMPDFISLASQETSGETIYKNVLFSTDMMGRRKCDLPSKDTRMHAVFFGGSYTFGHGVTNDKTLPCALQTISEGAFEVYNFGKQGFGTGQMYLLLRDELFMEPDIPTRGIAVYVFIEDHIDRTVGEISKLTGSAPYSQFILFDHNDENGELVPYRLEDRPLLFVEVQILRFLKQFSPTVRFVTDWIAMPLIPREEGAKVTADVVIAARDYYDKRFIGDFYVLIWPRSSLSPAVETAFIDRLERAGIFVLQPPEMPDENAARLHPLDGHPSPAEYRWVADFLWQIVRTGSE